MNKVSSEINGKYNLVQDMQPRRKKVGNGQSKFPEMAAECFWKLKKNINLQTQEVR